MIRILLVILIFSTHLSAQFWSVEPMFGIRADWNKAKVINGNVKTESQPLFNYGVEVSRQIGLKTHQGLGYSRHSFGTAYIIEEVYSDPLTLGLWGNFYDAVSFHHTYQFLKVERLEAEASMGGQLYFTRFVREQVGNNNANSSAVIMIEENRVGKIGVSPVAFFRLNLRFRTKPISKFTTFFRGQLNLGTRALYITSISYEGINSRGNAVIKNRGTGFMGAYGCRFEFNR